MGVGLSRLTQPTSKWLPVVEVGLEGASKGLRKTVMLLVKFWANGEPKPNKTVHWGSFHLQDPSCAKRGEGLWQPLATMWVPRWHHSTGTTPVADSDWTADSVRKHFSNFLRKKKEKGMHERHTSSDRSTFSGDSKATVRWKQASMHKKRLPIGATRVRIAKIAQMTGK
jgi:hypothetical protein